MTLRGLLKEYLELDDTTIEEFVTQLKKEADEETLTRCKAGFFHVKEDAIQCGKDQAQETHTIRS